MGEGASDSIPPSIKLEQEKYSFLTASCGEFLYDTIHATGSTIDVEKTISQLAYIKHATGNCGKLKGKPVIIGMLKNLQVTVSNDGYVLIKNSITTYKADSQAYQRTSEGRWKGGHESNEYTYQQKGKA